MLNSYKNVLFLFVILMLQACGGGGGKTTYYSTFNANVSGLAAGETVTVVAGISGTNQSVSTVVTANGMWSTTINLPDGVSFANGTSITVTQQPVGKVCSVTYTTLDVSNLSNTIKCVPVSAAGLYVGKVGTANGKAQLLILNDGSYWMWAGTETANLTTFSSLILSSAGSSTPTTYTSTTGVDIFSSPLVTNVSLIGTYVSGASFNGTLIPGSSQFALALTALPAVSYQFGDVPSLSKIAGTYSSAAESFTISSSGTVAGQTYTGCQFNGAVTPKATGENAYDVTITFGASPCTTAFQTVPFKGVMFIETTTLGTQLFGGITNSSKTVGMYLIETKR